MDESGLLRAGMTESEFLVEAIERRDKQKASEILCKGLEKFESVPRRMWKTAGEYFDCLVERFDLAQESYIESIGRDVANERYGEALETIGLKNGEFVKLHDLCMDIIVAIQSYIARTHGEEFLLDTLTSIGVKRKAWYEKMIKLEPENRVLETARALKMHMGHLKIEEDDKKYTFIMNPCGSGGRRWREEKVRARKGHYRTCKIHSLNLGRKGLPAYCSHCILWNTLLPLEWFGFPLWVYDLPRKAEDVCRLYLFKNLRDVPDDYFTGLRKKAKG